MLTSCHNRHGRDACVTSGHRGLPSTRPTCSNTIADLSQEGSCRRTRTDWLPCSQPVLPYVRRPHESRTRRNTCNPPEELEAGVPHETVAYHHWPCQASSSLVGRPLSASMLGRPARRPIDADRVNWACSAPPYPSEFIVPRRLLTHRFRRRGLPPAISLQLAHLRRLSNKHALKLSGGIK